MEKRKVYLLCYSDINISMPAEILINDSEVCAAREKNSPLGFRQGLFQTGSFNSIEWLELGILKKRCMYDTI